MAGQFDQQFSFRYEIELKKGQYSVTPSTKSASSNPVVNVNSPGWGDYRPGIDGVIEAIETTLGNALLQSNIFNSVCRGGIAKGPFRRGEYVRNLRDNNNQGRKMRAVGMTNYPDDEIIANCKL